MSKDEFRVHHHVSELMKRLGVGTPTSPGQGAEFYTEMLLKNMTPYVTTQTSAHQAKKKIAENTKTPVEFYAKYDELKAKNVRNLDQLTYFLSKLSSDEQMKYALDKHTKQMESKELGLTMAQHQQIIAQLPPTDSSLSAKELHELQEQLMSGSAKTAAAGDCKQTGVIRREERNIVTPPTPDWFNKPSPLTFEFFQSTGHLPTPLNELTDMPTLEVERAVLRDILHCMQGIDGSYIVSKPLDNTDSLRQFSIHHSLNTSVAELVKRMLPLCSFYSNIVRFCKEKSEFEAGLVNHALSAALMNLLKEYMVLINQLESQLIQGKLTLQKLWVYLQPTLRNFDLMSSTVTSLKKGCCFGASTLSLLHEKTRNLVGDEKGHELCLHLTQKASIPYFEILEKWIYKGIVRDPYCEFMIEENESIQKEALERDFTDQYWEGKYNICRERIPVFLETMADKILNTGKYLNVVRVCGKNVQCPSASEILYSVKDKKYYEQIDDAYTYASKVLLDLLFEENKIMARLCSLKNYFLLDKGDFILQFMDMTEGEMRQAVDDIMTTRLESLLELALVSSSAQVDPYKDDLKVDLLPYDLITQLFKIMSIETQQEGDYRIDPIDLQLTGLESFSFDYEVKWPVSLIISRKVLTKYQILFRHLFYCKYVDRLLCSIWQSNQMNHKFFNITAFTLRHQMLNFVQNIEYYMMFEVINPHWLTFTESLQTVCNIDEVLVSHNEFLKNCLQDCMLTDTKLLKIIDKLMMVCVTFCNFMQQQIRALTGENGETSQTTRDYTPPISNKLRRENISKKTTFKIVSDSEDIAAQESVDRTIKRFQQNFITLLTSLLDKIKESRLTVNFQDKFFNILHRLDFNGFYTNKQQAGSLERGVQQHFSAFANTDNPLPSPTILTTQHGDYARFVPGQHMNFGE